MKVYGRERRGYCNEDTVERKKEHIINCISLLEIGDMRIVPGDWVPRVVRSGQMGLAVPNWFLGGKDKIKHHLTLIDGICSHLLSSCCSHFIWGEGAESFSR